MAVTLIRPSQILNVPIGSNVPSFIHADNTETSDTNSAAETTMYTTTIAAGLLGINDGIIVDMYMSLNNSSGANRTLTWRWKYGATTVYTYTNLLGNIGAAFGVHRLFLKNQGATNSQRAAGWNSNQNFAGGAEGTAAVDSTVAQTLALTLQSDVATVTQVYTVYYTLVYFVKAT